MFERWRFQALFSNSFSLNSIFGFWSTIPGVVARKLQHSQRNKHESNEHAFHLYAFSFNTAHIITQTYPFLLLLSAYFFLFAMLFLSFSRLYLHLLIFSKQFHGGSMSSHRAEYVRDWVFSAAFSRARDRNRHGALGGGTLARFIAMHGRRWLGFGFCFSHLA